MKTLNIAINKILALVNLKLSKNNNLVYHAGTESVFSFFDYLGYEPQHIIDIGAHKGAWSLSAMNHFEKAYYSLFEPQSDLLTYKRLLNNPKVTIYKLGVGKSYGSFKLKSSHRRDSYNFMESHKSFDDSKDKIVKVVTLDNVFFDQSLSKPYPEIIKIDAEGWDLDVLLGAKKLINYCHVIFIEAGVNNLHFQNDFYTVVATLNDMNFRLIDISDLNRPNKQTKHLQNVELVFVKIDSYLDKLIKDELGRR